MRHSRLGERLRDREADQPCYIGAVTWIGRGALAWLALSLSWSPRPSPLARAEEPAARLDAARALCGVTDADPLELARVVSRLGDAAVLPLIGDDQPGPVRLEAIRAARWLAAPERALLRLAELSGGRDSLLGPAAARAALEIARELDGAALARREADPAELEAALAALRVIAEKPHVRADLRMMAAESAALLEASFAAPPAR